MALPEIKEFKEPIISELAKRGGRAPWRDIIEPVAERLGISEADRAIMTDQGEKSIPKYIQRLRWAGYRLKDEGVLDRYGGFWEITNR